MQSINYYRPLLEGRSKRSSRIHKRDFSKPRVTRQSSIYKYIPNLMSLHENALSRGKSLTAVSRLNFMQDAVRSPLPFAYIKRRDARSRGTELLHPSSRRAYVRKGEANHGSTSRRYAKNSLRIQRVRRWDYHIPRIL